MSNNESEVGQSLKQIIDHRLEKIKAIRDGGIDTFPHNFDLKDKVSDLLNVIDVVSLVSYVLEGAEYTSQADLNGDGSVNVADVVSLVNLILN